MSALAIFKAVVTDRVVQAGAGSSGLSFVGAVTSEQSDMVRHMATWLPMIAAFCGILSALSVTIYTCIKIKRLLATPSLKE